MDVDAAVARIVALLEAGRAHEAAEGYKAALAAWPREPRLVALRGRVPVAYDAAFHSPKADGSLRSAQIILSLLWTRAKCRSVVDFGAGVGTWLEAAASLGADVLVGIDGEWVRDVAERFAGTQFHYVDLSQQVMLQRRFDLAVSVEVGEHLPPDRGPSFVEDICRAADVCVFGAALPRQPGDGHVNCRPHSYWRHLFSQQGYLCLDAFRPAVWYDNRVVPWYAQNTYLYVRDGHPVATCFPPATLLDVYHPLMLNELVLLDHRNGQRDAPTA